MKKLAALLTLVPVLALAASVHFIGTPTLTDLGTILRATGKIAGLGEGDVTVILDSAGLASVQCRNAGGNVAPGQDTAVQTSGSATFPSPKNGNLVFAVTTLEPSIPSSACPNPNWTAEALDVAFASGTITVIQGGVIVLSQTF